jgi:hypothetical protein
VNFLFYYTTPILTLLLDVNILAKCTPTLEVAILTVNNSWWQFGKI